MATLELKQYYVAFLDILGFTNMVESDVSTQSSAYLTKLFKCHQSASHIFSSDPSCSITQFSDSVMVARPYDATEFKKFTRMVAEFQRLILDEEIICRGGIAVNKHFSNGTFTFSAGLIDAYKLESRSARYPRIVVSPEVIQLVFPDQPSKIENLVKEDDGLFFIDYLGLTSNKKPQLLKRKIESIVASLLKGDDPSIKEKGRWLANYSDAVLNTTLSTPKFSGRRVKSRP